MAQFGKLHKVECYTYNPRCNGQPERFNKKLVRMIKAYIKGDQTEWDKFLGCLAGAYRATINESTGFTPNFLMLGREVRLPAELMYSAPTEPEGFSVEYGEYVDTIRQKMQKAHDLARKHLKNSTRRHKDIYDAKATLKRYKKGDLVWYASGSAEQDITPKLRKKFFGPAVIVGKLSELTYLIQIGCC